MSVPQPTDSLRLRDGQVKRGSPGTTDGFLNIVIERPQVCGLVSIINVGKIEETAEKHGELHPGACSGTEGRVDLWM